MSKDQRQEVKSREVSEEIPQLPAAVQAAIAQKILSEVDVTIHEYTLRVRLKTLVSADPKEIEALCHVIEEALVVRDALVEEIDGLTKKA